MSYIGGNITGQLQTATYAPNTSGELVPTWETRRQLFGYLDMMSGSAGYMAYNAKIQESTHVFMCDHEQLPKGVDAETARMVIAGKVYDVTYIDNPMELGEHLEIFLKYTGGQ